MFQKRSIPFTSMFTYRNDDTGPWFENAQFLIFACGCQQTAIAIQGYTVDYIGMPVNDTHCLASVYIPHDNKMIEAGAEEHILRYRMPFDISDASFVPLQLHQPFSQVSRQSAIGYMPQFYLDKDTNVWTHLIFCILDLYFALIFHRKIIFNRISKTFLTVQSSEQDAMILSLNGFHLMSKTGPVCPVTRLALKSSRPVCNVKIIN